MEPSVDLITLEDLESKMPRWDPNAENHLFALVDMGSNGIRFSISDLTPPRTRLLKCLYRERASISLFDDLHASDTGSGILTFSDATIQLVSQTLARFRIIAISYGVPLDQISVFATEAMRRASNAGPMLDSIKQAAPGLSVSILAPEVETLFGSMGARSVFVHVKGLFLDLGGGSVQMTYVNSLSEEHAGYHMVAAQTGQSMPFGAARLIKVLDGSDSKLKTATKAELQNSMLAAFGKLCARFPDLEKAAVRQKKKDKDRDDVPGVDVYLCGGGFRGYGSMLMHNDPIQPYPVPLIGSYSVSGDFFKETKKMRTVNKDYKDKIFGMSKRRRQQFPAIATVVEALIDTFPNINTVTFCNGGNREGALLMRLPLEVREENPVALLGIPTSTSVIKDEAVARAVADKIRSAVPTAVTDVNIYPLDLVPLIVQGIWERIGEDDSANAAHALHNAVNDYPSAPGLNHVARASLAMALWARWGGGLAPVDKELLDNLRRLMGGPDADAAFWSEYLGATAACIAKVLPACPRAVGLVEEAIKFEGSIPSSSKNEAVHLKISVAPSLAEGLDLEELKDCYKIVGKSRKNGGKLVVQIDASPS